jgi:hypothetical protein
MKNRRKEKRRTVEKWVGRRKQGSKVRNMDRKENTPYFFLPTPILLLSLISTPIRGVWVGGGALGAWTSGSFHCFIHAEAT